MASNVQEICKDQLTWLLTVLNRRFAFVTGISHLLTAALLVVGAPGTVSRPVLSPGEAAAFTPSAYLEWSGPYDAPVADPWRPAPIRTQRADFVVGRGGFPTVQEAVNAAYRGGGKGFRAETPWAPAATTGRPFTASIAPDRDLDDVTTNRLWEYRVQRLSPS